MRRGGFHRASSGNAIFSSSGPCWPEVFNDLCLLVERRWFLTFQCGEYFFSHITHFSLIYFSSPPCGEPTHWFYLLLCNKLPPNFEASSSKQLLSCTVPVDQESRSRWLRVSQKAMVEMSARAVCGHLGLENPLPSSLTWLSADLCSLLPVD